MHKTQLYVLLRSCKLHPIDLSEVPEHHIDLELQTPNSGHDFGLGKMTIKANKIFLFALIRPHDPNHLTS